MAAGEKWKLSRGGKIMKIKEMSLKVGSLEMHFERFKNQNFCYAGEADIPSPGSHILGGGMATGEKNETEY